MATTRGIKLKANKKTIIVTTLAGVGIAAYYKVKLSIEPWRNYNNINQVALSLSLAIMSELGKAKETRYLSRMTPLLQR